MANDKGLEEGLAKAREKRAGNVKAKKTEPTMSASKVKKLVQINI